MAELVELCSRECCELLGRHRVGRLAVVTPLGPRIVPVNYSVDQSDVFFRTAPFSEVGTYARNEQVAFEVDEIDEDSHLGTSVVVFGRAEPIEDYDERMRVRAQCDPVPWASGRRTLYFRIHLRDVTGRRLRDMSLSAGPR